jgi:predicted Zn-dependent protease
LAALVLLLGACSDDNPAFFSLEDDIAMGREVKNQVEADTSDFTVLDSASNPEPYQYLYSIQDKILASDDVRYTEEFVWRTRIIVDDETLNAFAAPGGFIYLYTGLIKFLEREDELAGVLAHEIAHADRRHSAQQIQKQYGLNVVLSALTGGDPGLLAQVTGSLLSLTFSRSDESEADEYSVRYLCDTEYASDGAAGFFEKIQDQGGASPPEFLSTHPNPSNRVEDITGLAQELECNLDNATEVSYQDFKQMLP